MATITDLHTSISEMSNEEIFAHIRLIRSLRREMPIKAPHKTTKKQNKKQITIEEHLNKMNKINKEALLKKLLKLKRERQND